jgi:hypothetical protein
VVRASNVKRSGDRAVRRRSGPCGVHVQPLRHNRQRSYSRRTSKAPAHSLSGSPSPARASWIINFATASPALKMMGIVVVGALAVSAGKAPPQVAITAARRRTRSVASASPVSAIDVACRKSPCVTSRARRDSSDQRPRVAPILRRRSTGLLGRTPKGAQECFVTVSPCKNRNREAEERH